MKLNGPRFSFSALAFAIVATLPCQVLLADPIAEAKKIILLFLAKDPALPTYFDEAMTKALPPPQATLLADQMAAKGSS